MPIIYHAIHYTNTHIISHKYSQYRYTKQCTITSYLHNNSITILPS
nr:MAG TPA: hypothetical protein [Caudoviricetes sp.]